MQTHEALRVDMQPVLGNAATIGMQYLQTPEIVEGAFAAPEPPMPPAIHIPVISGDLPRTAPYPPPEILQRLEWIALEIQGLRADNERRSAAGRTRRLWAWLKGFFTWPSQD